MIKTQFTAHLQRGNRLMRRFQSSAAPLAGADKKKMGSIAVSQQEMKKKGFSNLKKVPSTMDLEPKHILLDKLYQGYQPLMLPHSPDMLQDKTAKKPLFINILEGISLEDYDKHLTVEDHEEDLDIDEAYHTPTMMFSKYIFNKNPETEKKLESLKKLASSGTSVSSSGQDDVNNKVAMVGEMFKKRTASQGRLRLQFKSPAKKDSKISTDNDPEQDE